MPVYNESKNLKKLVEEVHESLSKHYKYELIIVNDGSKDNSNYIIEELKHIFPIKLIQHEKNFGQSRSILSGIKNSSYNIVVTIDGDGQNNPFDIPLLLNTYLSFDKISLVGGIRNKRKDNLIKIISSKIANTVRAFILSDDCVDTGCSLKVFNKDIFMKFPYY